jgi:hypothetical protein
LIPSTRCTHYVCSSFTPFLIICPRHRSPKPPIHYLPQPLLRLPQRSPRKPNTAAAQLWATPPPSRLAQPSTTSTSPSRNFVPCIII